MRDGIAPHATDKGMNTRRVSALVFFFGALGSLTSAVVACSSSGNSSANDGGANEGLADGQVRLPDGAVVDPTDGATLEDGALLEDGGPGSYCPTAKANEAVYCQSFDGPGERVGTWTLAGEPSFDDAGAAPREDQAQFWSAPSSRYLYNSSEDAMLRGTAVGPLPVKQSTMRFRYRPSSAPYATNGHYLAYVTLGDSTLAIAWLDYGRLDASKAGTKGYALIHHVTGGATPDVWAPLTAFPAQNIWSAVELSIRSTGACAVAFDGVSAGELTAVVSASTSGRFGFGPYFTGTAQPTYMSGNADDVVAVISR